MISPKNPYTEMQFNQYLNGTNNHENHNANPDYWSILLGMIKGNEKSWKGKRALDFGCGKGRNVINLLSLVDDWSSVDGVDISPANIESCRTLSLQKSEFYVTDGTSLNSIENSIYDFVMSTIVFQHICVFDIRDAILRDIHRTMVPGGILSFQMGYGPEHSAVVLYHSNAYDAKGTNGMCDVRVTSEAQIKEHLEEIGFINVETSIRPSFQDNGHPQWIYTKATKG